MCLVGNSALVVFKGTVGLLTGSMAIVADACHSGVDAVCAVAALVTIYLGKKPVDKSRAYGYGKTEFAGGALSDTVLICVASYIAISSLSLLTSSDPLRPPHYIAMGAAIVSILTNEMLHHHALCVGTRVNSSVIEALAWDNRADALLSIPVFLGVLGAQLGYPALDPLAALLLAVLLGTKGFISLRRNVQGLMDLLPLESTEVGRMRELTAAVPGVKGIGYLKTRAMGRQYLADMEILVDPTESVEKSHRIAGEVRDVVRREIRLLGDVAIVCRPYAEGQENEAR
jgi:cation diffusion facilitator family transporter